MYFEQLLRSALLTFDGSDVFSPLRTTMAGRLRLLACPRSAFTTAIIAGCDGDGLPARLGATSSPIAHAEEAASRKLYWSDPLFTYTFAADLPEV